MKFYVCESALAGSKFKSLMLIQRFARRWKNHRKLRLEGKLPPLKSLYDMASRPKTLSAYMAGNEDEEEDEDEADDMESLVSNKSLFSLE